MTSKFGGIRVSESKFGGIPVEPEEEIEPNYGEAALSMANSALVEPIAGFAGMAKGMDMFSPKGASGAMVNTVRDSLTFDRSEGGDKALENIGEFIAPALEVLRMPVSGLVGLGEIATFQGVDQAGNSVKKTQSEGVGSVLGDRILEETGSPELAALAKTSPDAVMALVGLGATRSLAKKIPQSKKKQLIAEKLKAGSADADTARYELTDAVTKKPTDFAGNSVVNFAEKSEVGPVVKPRVVNNKQAVKAIDQGWTEGAVANVKSSTPATKKKMKHMVDIMEKAKKNDRFAKRNRPSNILGDSLMDRYRVVRDQNQKAGKQLKAQAKNLEGKPLDVSGAVDTFIDDLDDLGIKVSTDGDFKISFDGSDIEQIGEVEKIVDDIVKRMKKTGGKAPDAYQAHRLKKYIDEQVTYGKNAKGLSGTVERVLKKLRHNIDETLDDNFPEYDAVNSTYSETRNAIDSLQDTMGKIELSGPNADKATGTKLRALLSNNTGRVNLENAVDEIERVASQYRKFNDSIDAQTVFVDALDKRFGPVAETSFQGQIVQGTKQAVNAAADPSGKGMGDLVTDIVGKGYNKIKGVTDERAYKAIRDLLDR